VDALLTALTKTQIYLGARERGEAPNQRREAGLAMAWSKAAGAFRGVAPEVAPLLQLKSEVWARPEEWSRARVREAGITVDAMAELARGYLAQPRS
jgi:hypothetical protein